MVTVKVIGYISETVGFKEKELKVKDPTPLGKLLDLQGLEEDVLVLVNGKPATLDYKVSKDDIVKIVAILAGG